MTSDRRITKKAPYGQHIAITCKNHPDLRWSTKNISPIGCRSIFFNLMRQPGMGPECDCSGSVLIPAPESLTGEDVPE